MLSEGKVKIHIGLIRVLAVFVELALIYFINKGQNRINIYYLGDIGAYVYHLLRASCYIAPVACAYILIHAYIKSADKTLRLLDDYVVPRLALIINVATFCSMIYLVLVEDVYNGEVITDRVSLLILAHALELVCLGTIPLIIQRSDEWPILFQENLNRPIKVLIIMTFLYVGYVDRIISNFIGSRLIAPTVSLAQFFYKFTGGVIRISHYDDRGRPIIMDNNFYGTVNPGCSGYEGISFIVLFLILFFPYLRRVFNYFELIIICIFCLLAVFLMNAIRLALLVYVGEHVSVDVAIGGFHTNFGVLTLVVVSTICMGGVWLKTKFNGQSKTNSASNHPIFSALNVDAYLILPLTVLLASSLFTGLFSDNFNWLYPVTVTCGALALIPLRDRFKTDKVISIYLPLLVGFAVFVIWIAIIPRDYEYEKKFAENLTSHGSTIALIWIVFRIIGSSIIVPIVEELAFRGVIWDTIIQSFDYKISVNIKKIAALILTSIAFGFLHDDIIAATIAGFLYGLMRYYDYGKSYPLTAHIITNSLISVYVIIFKAWSYW